MIRLEDICISNLMLDAIRYWQENDKGGLEEDVKAIDSAITFIACEHDAPGVLSEKESLSLIAALSFLKKRLCLFEGKEEPKKLQEALRLLDIVTDVNGQYSKEERMRAAMRLEELLRLLLPEE